MKLSNQFVVVLNKKHETGRLMNTVAHLSAGLVNLHKENIKALRFDNYEDANGNAHPSISDHDPGRPGRPSVKVHKELFLKAWYAPDEQAANIIAVRRA